MKTGRKEHEEAKLLPHLEPPVEPVGEPGVLGAPEQLDVGGQHPGEIAHGQQLDGMHSQRLVQVLHWHIFPGCCRVRELLA